MSRVAEVPLASAGAAAAVLAAAVVAAADLGPSMVAEVAVAAGQPLKSLLLLLKLWLLSSYVSFFLMRVRQSNSSSSHRRSGMPAVEPSSQC